MNLLIRGVNVFRSAVWSSAGSHSRKGCLDLKRFSTKHDYNLQNYD